MSQYVIEIDESVITEQINKILNSIVNRELQKCLYGAVHQNIVAEAVKEIIYSKKDEIIEATVKRASTEIQKRAFPKLLDKLEGNSNDNN